MSFSSSLSNAMSGMNVAKTAIQIRSNNIANASTAGYARRDIALHAKQNGGVQIKSVIRAQDHILMGERLSADAREAETKARTSASGQLNRDFGKPGDKNGLFAILTRFNSSLQNLANTPESASYQQGAVSAANDLVRSFNRLGTAATTLRTNADKEIGDTVRSVNDALKALDTLNKVGSKGEINGLSNLPEQRQKHIDTIAKALDIKVSRSDNGRVSIMTDSGVLLLGNSAREISFKSSGTVAPGTRMSAGQLSGISVDGIDITPGASAQSVQTGSIAGHFAVRDEIGVAFEERIDALATDMVARFSDSSVDSSIAAGAEGLFVSGGAGAGIASRLSVNAAVDPRQGGKIWRMRDGIGATAPGPSAAAGVTKGLLSAVKSTRPLTAVTQDASSLSAIDTVAAFASVIGTAATQEATAATASSSTAQGLRDKELSVLGVNTDQELLSLLRIEQAYSANARVVKVVSEMMARLLEI